MHGRKGIYVLQTYVIKAFVSRSAYICHITSLHGLAIRCLRIHDMLAHFVQNPLFSDTRRKFAGRGSWRRGAAQAPDVDPVVWLPPAGVPIPPTKPTKAGGSRRKDEYHLAELGTQFWGHGQPTEFNPEIIASVYSTLKSTK